jgi:hypothetical protein
MNVALREHGTFDNQDFKCGKVYYSNSINITNFMWTLIPKSSFENIFPAYFRIDVTQQNVHIIPWKLINYMSWLLTEAVLYIIALIVT